MAQEVSRVDPKVPATTINIESRVAPSDLVDEAQRPGLLIERYAFTAAAILVASAVIWSIFSWAISAPVPGTEEVIVEHQPGNTMDGGGSTTVTDNNDSVAYTPTAECPGVKKSVSLDDTWRVINPGGLCKVVHDFHAGSLEFSSSENPSVTLASTAGYDESVVVCARSSQPGVTRHGNYALCPLESGDTMVGFNCKPLK
jgi:hypothetical protein